MIDGFLNYIRFERRYSPRTYAIYKKELANFERFLWSTGILPQEASRRNIKAWIYALHDQGLKPRTINIKITAVKSFYRYLFRKEIIRDNPAKSFYMLRTGSSLPYFVDSEDLNRLLDELEFPPGYVGARDKIILEILYGTGIRVAELTALRDYHFNPHSSRLKVTGKGNKDRIVPLFDELRDMISEYLKVKKAAFPESEALILGDKGSPIGSSRVETIVKKYLSLVTDIGQRSPHVLRHSFATHLHDNGANLKAVSELLGHESIISTQIYTHTAVKKLKRDFDKAHPKK